MQRVRIPSLSSVITTCFVPLVVVAALLLPGCGDGGGEFSQDFERPDVEPPPLQHPPDTGDDLHPRERDEM